MTDKEEFKRLFQDPPQTDEFALAIARITRKREELAVEEEAFSFLVQELQKKCPHEKMVEVRKYDPDYHYQIDGSTGFNIFVGNKCSVCKFFRPRRPGIRTEICHMCGGDMKYHGPFQCGMDRAHIDKCQSCGHEVETL